MAEVDGALCDWCKQEAEGLALVAGILYVSCGKPHHKDQTYLRWRLKVRNKKDRKK